MKTIVVPVDQNAMQRLDIDQSRAGDLIEFLFEKEAFDEAFRNGYFTTINKAADIIIDDYEDEQILNAQALEKVIEISQQYHQQTGQSEYQKVSSLAREAIERRTGLFFFF